VAIAGDPGDEELASIYDLNPSGLGFRSVSYYEPQTRLQLRVPLYNREVRASATIVHVETVQTPHGRIHRHGVRFDALSMEDRDAIELHCTHHAVPLWRKRYRQSLDFFARTGELMNNSRGTRRLGVQLAARVLVEQSDASPSATLRGMLDEISATGARLVLDAPVAPGTAVGFEVPGTTLRGRGKVVFSTALESPMGVRFSVGLTLTDQAAAAPPRRWLTRFGRGVGSATPRAEQPAETAVTP
jgi:hypothetical protein